MNKKIKIALYALALVGVGAVVALYPAQTLALLNSVPAEAWEAVVSALVVSPLMVGVIKWFHINRESVRMYSVLFASVFAAAVSYLHGDPKLGPQILIPAQGIITFALTQPIWYNVTKPLRNKVRASYEQAELLAAQERAGAKVPSGGIPNL